MLQPSISMNSGISIVIVDMDKVVGLVCNCEDIDRALLLIAHAIGIWP